MEVICEAPTSDSYIPLSTHQSQTPQSFYSGPPVLYHHSPSATLQIHASDLTAASAFSGFAGGTPLNHVNGSATTNGDDASEEDRELSIPNIDIWVTSEHFILFHPSRTTGLSIPYPSISLHAIQRSNPTSPSSLFLQIQTSSPTFDDHDPDSTISLSLIPSIATAPIPSDAPVPASGEDQPFDPTSVLYAALSACANLHPDPASGSEGADAEDPTVMFEGDVDQDGYTFSDPPAGGLGGLPPPMPGSGGWITAENVGEFFDEEGNWKGEGEAPRLGEGAGVVRGRDEGEDGGGVGDGDGDGDGEETKWRRTE